MSKAARELAVKFVRHFGLDPEHPDDDGTCDKCISDVDEAVAPLVSALEGALPYIPVNSKTLDEALKALEPWRKK